MSTLRGYVPPANGQTAISGQVELAWRPLDMNDADDREYAQVTSAQAVAAAEDSWRNYERIGEVRYAIARSARLAGYGRLMPVKVNAAGVIEEERDHGVVADIVQGIYSPFGGTRGLIERFYTLRKVPGEGWLAAIREGGMVDGYHFLSSSELDRESLAPDQAAGKPIKWRTTRRFRTTTGNVKMLTRTIQPNDFYGRVWAPSHQYVDEIDTPMEGLNSICDMLHMLTESIKGRLQQRFAIAGILLIPNEISDAAISGNQPNANKYSNDKVLNYLVHVMTTNIGRYHDDALGKIPILLKGPADVLDKVKHIILEASVAETDLKLRAELINRILDGLDQNKSAVQGMEDQSHFGAWQQSDEERRVAVQPDLEAMCHALTRGILWRELKGRGWEDARIRPWRVWFDLSAAAVKSNQMEDARQAYDRGLISGDYVRKVMGADNAAMGDEEYIRWIGMQTKNPILAVHGLESVDVDWDRAERWGKKSGPEPDSRGDEPEAGPGGGGSDGSPDSRDTDTPDREEPT